MWDIPGPGLEPVSPALAGRFLTTAPPGKSPEGRDLTTGPPGKSQEPCILDEETDFSPLSTGEQEWVFEPGTDNIPGCAIYSLRLMVGRRKDGKGHRWGLRHQ